ncbi:MAG: ribonuclease HI [Clostridiales bacterium]|nr:ribonuclease HI [Clostridiales bacterium]
MKKVEIYTDGACSGNPGPGGWAAILSYKGYEKELSGSELETTNNRMELTAPIKALEALKEPCNVVIYTDSAYVYNAFEQGWIEIWQKHNWLNRRKKPVENQDLWQHLLKVMRIHNVKWIKVKGHSDNEKNNRCDNLAKKAIQMLLEENS